MFHGEFKNGHHGLQVEAWVVLHWNVQYPQKHKDVPAYPGADYARGRRDQPHGSLHHNTTPTPTPTGSAETKHTDTKK